MNEMKTFEFTIVLEGVSEVTEAVANSLFVAGCDDGTFVSHDGQAMVQFDREAESLEAAVESAIAQVESAGLSVARVESEEFSTIHRFNEQLTQA